MPHKDRPLTGRHRPKPGGEGWLVNVQEQLVANTSIRLIAATTHLAAAFTAAAALVFALNTLEYVLMQRGDGSR